MTETAAAPPRLSNHRLSLDDPGAITALGGVLRSANYTEQDIRRACGSEGTNVIAHAELPILVRRLPQEGLLPVLIRLFMLGVRVDRAVAARSLAPLTPEGLEALGLVRLASGAVEPLVKISPFHPHLLVGDPHYQDPLSVPVDYVIGVNQTSLNIVSLTVRRPVKAALDIGTGCGVAALHAATFCERVVATDINPRALNFTAFNALLNDLRNVEVRQGSLFEPVSGESFDLVMSNPPYVISPDSDYQYRDSGRDGDALCRSLVRDLPRHLNDGGYASILSNWALRPGQQWIDPVKEWIRDSECDALVLHTQTSAPLTYAGDWNRPLLPQRPKEYEAAVDRWTDYFRRSDISGLAMGGLILRRRKGASNWIAAEELPVSGNPGTSDQILRIFEAQDWLAGGPDLQAAALRPVEDLRFEQSVTVANGEMSIHGAKFSLPRGFKMEGNLDPRTMVVIGHCDGKRTLGEILDRLGPPGDPQGIRGQVVATIRKLFSLGYLVRA